MQADLYIHKAYVSSEAVGSGNGFGEILVPTKPPPNPVPWGGVLGVAVVISSHGLWGLLSILLARA